MIPFVVLERVNLPGDTSGSLVLSQRGEHFSIRAGGVELMNSQNHVSEDELGRLTCARLAPRATKKPTLLVGGLGMGYTLRAALDALPPHAQVDVAELVPDVVRWNRTVLGALAQRPLDDPRVRIIEGDVGNVIRKNKARYDAILLDVDNGPDRIFEGNATLYGASGLSAARGALTEGGVLAVWSSFESPAFTKALRKAGFEVEIETLRTTRRGGARHCIWFGRRRRGALEGQGV
ncbi:hypothetical protein [Pendulispora albinea]|uniref:Spermidine synthase n=1 Tax=Pendulispora albinea TaxID=2741071 RepID=A0ABZ2LRT2_9BACT